MTLDTVEGILDLAIGQEERAIKFYSELAAKMSAKPMAEVFLVFAEEEKEHKAKLLAIREGKLLMPAAQQVLDLEIGDYLEEVNPSADLDYRQALVLAMKGEKGAFKLYSDLASTTDDPRLRATLLGLAQEEAKHRLRFEIEYDDQFLTSDT
jgi:rubrerythrin